MRSEQNSYRVSLQSAWRPRVPYGFQRGGGEPVQSGEASTVNGLCSQHLPVEKSRSALSLPLSQLSLRHTGG